MAKLVTHFLAGDTKEQYQVVVDAAHSVVLVRLASPTTQPDRPKVDGWWCRCGTQRMSAITVRTRRSCAQ